eukprot:6100158-Pyramimonas_sp.AAC.1
MACVWHVGSDAFSCAPRVEAATPSRCVNCACHVSMLLLSAGAAEVNHCWLEAGATMLWAWHVGPDAFST